MRFPESVGNRMYLFCTGCEKDPFELGRRKKDEYQATRTPNLLEGWFDSHSKCLNGPDRFKLAHQFACNHDVPLDADPVSNAVRLELVKANG